MFDQLKNLKSLAGLMGNAGELKKQFEQMQAELATKTVEADAGAGAVRVVVNGQFEVKSVRIDPVMLAALTGNGADTDREMVEELIASAINAAMVKAQALMREEMSKKAGEMDIPGIDKLLGGLG